MSPLTIAEILKKIGRFNLEQMAPKHGTQNSDLVFFTYVRSRTNSKVVRNTADVHIAGIGGCQKKLRCMATGVQLPPSFCTGGLKVEKNCGFGRNWRPLVCWVICAQHMFLPHLVKE